MFESMGTHSPVKWTHNTITSQCYASTRLSSQVLLFFRRGASYVVRAQAEKRHSNGGNWMQFNDETVQNNEGRAKET